VLGEVERRGNLLVGQFRFPNLRSIHKGKVAKIPSSAPVSDLSERRTGTLGQEGKFEKLRAPDRDLIREKAV
jgi:hypothetical protein